MIKTLLQKGIDWLLYSHIWIATAALLMCMQTDVLLSRDFENIDLYAFVATGTLAIYAIHRLVALDVIAVDIKGRFKALSTLKQQVLLYAILAAIAAAYFFLQLSFSLQLLLFIPNLLALAYVMPIWNGKRLRDFPFIKIFLIAIAWAWITVIAPLHQVSISNWSLALMFVERALFIFAITLPFDIRDLEMDHKASVSTIPGTWGVGRSKQLAFASLLAMLMCACFNYYIGLYAATSLLALSLSAFSTAFLIYQSNDKQHDYFYSGLMDGTMIVQFVLVWFLL